MERLLFLLLSLLTIILIVLLSPRLLSLNVNNCYIEKMISGFPSETLEASDVGPCMQGYRAASPGLLTNRTYISVRLMIFRHHTTVRKMAPVSQIDHSVVERKLRTPKIYSAILMHTRTTQRWNSRPLPVDGTNQQLWHIKQFQRNCARKHNVHHIPPVISSFHSQFKPTNNPSENNSTTRPSKSTKPPATQQQTYHTSHPN
jgi:hypothetical protein